MDWLVENWLSLVLCVVSILVGFLISYFFFRKGQARRATSYLFYHVTVIDSEVLMIPNLSLYYKGHGAGLGSFTISHFYFWNSGTETLRKGDIVKQHPLEISAKNGAVILEQVISENLNPANNFDVQRNQTKDKLTITFNFMNRDEGIHLLMLHTGKSPDDITFGGELIGAGNPVPQIHGLFRHSRLVRVSYWISLGVQTFLIVFAVIRDYIRFDAITQSASTMLGLIFGTVLGWIIIPRLRIKLPIHPRFKDKILH